MFSFNSPEAELCHAPDSGRWTWPWAQSAHGAPAQGLCLKVFWFPRPLPAGSLYDSADTAITEPGQESVLRRRGSRQHLGTGWPHRGGNAPSQCTCCLGSRLSPAGPGDPVSLAETAGTMVCHCSCCLICWLSPSLAQRLGGSHGAQWLWGFGRLAQCPSPSPSARPQYLLPVVFGTQL